MSGVLPGSAISPFVAEWLPRVAAAIGVNGRPRRALDLAMGEGRHAVPLALAGFETFGVDLSVERLATACRAARDRSLTFHAWAADLDTYPLPAERFDLLFCTRFLLRARWDDLKRSVRPGGFVMYETFTVHQIKLAPRACVTRPPAGAGRTGRGVHATGTSSTLEEVDAPAALASLVARKPGGTARRPTLRERRS